MGLLNKLPGYTRSPSGFEWVLFKKIPVIFLLGTVPFVAIICSIYFSNDTLNPAQEKIIYQCLGVLFSYWFFVGATAIGCIVVMLMKGPAYVADPYELPKDNMQQEK